MIRTDRYRIGRALSLLARLLFALSFLPAHAAADTTPTPTAQMSPGLPPSPPGELETLIDAGVLPALRWPNFADHQADVARFYAAGGYQLAWVRDGQPTPQGMALIQLFARAAFKGLRPDDYDATLWDARLGALAPSNPHPAATALTEFDLALTVCAARYIADLHLGRINPQYFKFGLEVGPARYDLAQLLREQVMVTPDVGAVVATVEPHYDGYRRAEEALAAYLMLDAGGDAPPVPSPAKAVHQGDTYSGINALAARLHQLGDLAPDAGPPADSSIYDESLVEAVKAFQRRHGLQPDGVLGAEAVTQLNVPLSQRIKQLQFALERYRWIPPSFPQPPLIVNLPEFRLHTMRRQPAPFLSMPVVVGKAFGHQTPVFADYMRYLIFRPYWNVPLSIQFAELVPKIRRNRNYLATHGFEVTTSGGILVTDGPVSDDVLRQLSAGALVIRQKPGPKNALGLVKFIFPNHYNVYLHSTPAPELFLKARRDFSHGCIRVMDPVALAAWVLRDRPEWSVDKIRATMNGTQTVQVGLAQPIPVLILYATATVEPDGEVQFFRDIYSYDSAMEKALAGDYPQPVPK